MITKVRKWGNSLAVRIPLAVAKETQLHSGATIRLTSHDGQIVIAPVQEQRYRLADLLKGVTHENLHGEVSCGDAVGKEVW
jgi:antitoxin MazE